MVLVYVQNVGKGRVVETRQMCPGLDVPWHEWLAAVAHAIRFGRTSSGKWSVGNDW